MKFDDLVGKDTVIWGAGREGRAVFGELSRRGLHASFVVTGDATVPDDLASITVTGSAALSRALKAQVVIKSPGIAHTSPEYIALAESNVVITSLMDLWMSEHHERVIGVTGTKGKSTTSTLVHHIAAVLGLSPILAGNVGTPIAENLDESSKVAVLEVSSYQAAELTVSPRIAVVTSLSPEHLPWHGGFEQYVADKLNLVAHKPEVVVVSSDARGIRELVRGRVGEFTRVLAPSDLGIIVTDDGISWLEVGWLSTDEVPLQGKHNLNNVALALAAVFIYAGLEAHQREAALNSIRTFTPLKHRLEVVPSEDGRVWVDDGLATTPEAVIAALQAYERERVLLLLGGSERNLSFRSLIDHLEVTSSQVRVVCFGPAGHRFVSDAAGRIPKLVETQNFTGALALARKHTVPGDVIMLSPCAPSFDEFVDYEERSSVFRAAAVASNMLAP